ncbi:MAG: carbohydrate ABC transporter permease [Oscillospiraceae bacterium]|jgi:putative aldouronate transport system permease protein|nr:carbohydrate ABC transporter permease [Oscillospiraceae bacterium]
MSATNPARPGRQKNRNRIKTPASFLAFNYLGKLLVGLVALTCLLPFIMLVSASFTNETYIATHGFDLWPGELSTKAYETLFKNPSDIFRAYGVTLVVTGAGTLAGLMLISMTAYVLSRKDLKYRNRIAFFFYFTTLFNGGLISTYIFLVRYLGLKNNLLALILPLLFNVFYLLIMRSFMASIPASIIESAKIDGAGEMRVYVQLVLPLAKPGLATIGLFIALDYWNDWYNAMLYISKQALYPLQYLLYNMISSAQALARIASQTQVAVAQLPSQSLRMAMAVVAMGPILLVYPFVQKYFVKGITIGAVKG